MNFNLTKEDTLFLKGLAITLIALHNFTHVLPNVPVENEFFFNPNGIKIFFSEFFFDRPIHYFFSFWGHYGVQVFIFISAYAFYLKRENIKSSNKFTFIKERYSKIFWPFLASLCMVLILRVILILIDPSLSNEKMLKLFFGPIVWGGLKFTTITAFIPGWEQRGAGPWWFIPFILQFYILLPWLLRVKVNFWLLSILGISITLAFDTYTQIDLRFSVFGHIPEIMLGFWFAKNNHLKISRNKVILLISVSVLCLILANSIHFIWYFSNVFSTLCFVLILLMLKKFCHKKIITFASYLGGISIYIFFINAPLRHFIMTAYGSSVEYWAQLFELSIFFILTILLSIFAAKIEPKLKNALLSTRHVLVRFK